MRDQTICHLSFRAGVWQVAELEQMLELTI